MINPTTKIIEIISEIKNQDTHFLQNNITTPDLWDSIDFVEIILAIEAEFSISFSPDELSSLKTIQEIIDTLKQKI